MKPFQPTKQLEQRLKDASQPVVISTLVELRTLLANFRGGRTQDINLKTAVSWTDDKGKKQTAVVGAKSGGGSLRDALLDGMNKVKLRLDANEQMKQALKNAKESGQLDDCAMQVWNVDHLRFNVDQLIELRMGGKRRGLRIRWVLQEGIFEFDPFQDKLYGVDK